MYLPRLNNLSKQHIFFLLLVLSASLLRIWDLDRWLPQFYEEATPVLKARAFWGWQTGSFDFNPHFFNYPAFSFYIHFFFQVLWMVFCFCIGQINSLADFRHLIGTDLPSFVLLGRSITMLFDMGIIVLVYFFGKRLSNIHVGLIAALLMALNNLHVRLSQYVIVDIPLTFFIMLALWYILAATSNNKRTTYLKAGLCIGLATATKYTAALLLIPFVIMALPRLLQRHQRHATLIDLVLGVTISLGIFLLICPFTLLDFESFIKDFSYEQKHVARGHFGNNTQMTTPLFYATALWNIAGITTIAAFGALIHTIRKRDLYWGLLFIWIGTYLLVIASWEMRAEHYLLPIIPALIIVSALGLYSLITHLNGHWKKALLTLFIALYTLPQCYSLLEHYNAVSAPETRAQAASWIETNIPSGKLVALEHYTYYPTMEALDHWLVRLPMDILNPQQIAPFYRSEWYENFDYIVLSSYVFQRYITTPLTYPQQIKFYQYLEKNWSLANHINPRANVGPEIRIYQNPSITHPDTAFALSLYRGLEPAGKKAALKFLRILGYALNERGYKNRSQHVAMMRGKIKAMKN